MLDYSIIDEAIEGNKTPDGAAIAVAKILHNKDVEMGIATKEDWGRDRNYRESMIHEAKTIIQERLDAAL